MSVSLGLGGGGRRPHTPSSMDVLFSLTEIASNVLFYKCLEQEADIQRLRKWFWGLGELKKMDRIIIPINIPGHWITVVIHVRERVIHVEDPLGNAHDDIASRVREWLEWVERSDKPNQRELDSWDYRVQVRKRQTNGVDCGIFCLADIICKK